MRKIFDRKNNLNIEKNIIKQKIVEFFFKNSLLGKIISCIIDTNYNLNNEFKLF